jgi:ATP-dependent Clp protease ATP-binding subunit ClpA
VPGAPGKPLGAFLFAGPSGSGKTHVARSLARRLFGDARALVKIEMPRYSSAEDLPRLMTDVDTALLRRQSLTGLDPAGRGGVLAFDRADEAAPEALAWLSSWIEGDWRTNMAGWADALPGWLVVLGTRGGIAEVLRDRAKPVVDRERDRVHRHIRADVERHVQATFAVGLLNRLDDVLSFEPLGPESLGQILVARLRELAAMWEPLGVGVKVEDEARDWIVAASEVPELGAWALEWNFERRVQGPLSELLLRSRPERGSSLVVSLTDDPMSIRKLIYRIRRRGTGT